ncbi:methyl-accepting chemotaxis protein [Sphingomonas rubra]|uniref:Methyl-accepting chemotaxis sensory transducer with Pas/Pac sensor n=1 Tax=Sphingomonas rubra TaxID=634430 RepID=A0A1I5SAX3_9SPHN|nr:methyl-accepting chemotaxis protein [Sphingomonas rubra]SFP67852.1 methyl-accepting chemotaxis sensory transducer with Pas/Pac sensor [Sphingomonas rubra]
MIRHGVPAGVGPRPGAIDRADSLAAFDDSYCRAAWIAVCRSQAVVEFDMTGVISWANDGFLSLVGYRLDEIVGRHHQILCHRDYVATPAYQAFWRKLAAGEFDAGEYPRRRADGSEIWLQATYNPIFDADGVARRVLKVATDVTRQVQLERQVKLHLEEATSYQATLQDRGAALHRSVQALAEIVGYISRIADESKLLALNASIEAARSGEAGRGFAVVAGEVRKLADDTRAATRRASELILAEGTDLAA